jgi:Ca2+-binding EF-hand superfamily protein
MSIGAVSGQSAALNQTLLSLLSRMNSAQFSDAFATPAAGTSSTQPAAASSSGSADGCKSSGTPQLSSDILRVMMAIQEQGPSGTTKAASASAGTSGDPAQQLFSALDSDSDGTVSQSELETYIEKQGGTQQQADSLYSSLNQNGAAGLSENQIASAAQQGAGASHGRHHHHHGGGGGIADKAASDLLNAADSNGDGTLNQSEFENFVSQIGGSTSEADQDFAALTAGKTGASGGPGSLTASSLADALKALDASKVDLQAQSSPILSVLDAIGSGTANKSAKPGSSA